MSEQNIEQKVIQTYQENISYLKEKQPRIYQKIYEFESAIDNGYYTPKYELEYKDGGYFDVKEIESGRYFYGVDSKKYAKKASKITNFKKNESTFKTFYDHDFSDEEIAYYEKEGIESSYYAYSKIMRYTRDLRGEDDNLKEIKKFIFFGIGLGTHIEEIDRKIKAKNYLLVEDDLELFRLSLFVTNYKSLAEGATLFFAIFEEQDDANSIFSSFLEKSFYYNHYIKYFQMQSADDAMVKLMQTAISGQRHLIFLFSAYFLVYLRAISYLKDGYNFLDVSSKEKSDVFMGKPVIIVAAGPSLGKNIEWLKRNKERFVVVALTATLSMLEKHGIKPDIITHLDPFEKTCMVHIDKVKDRSFYEDALLFCGSQTPKVLLDRFEKEKIFIAQVTVTYKKAFDFLEPICVGSFTYMLLTMLGVRELYSLGMDLAIDKSSGYSHAKGHEYSRKLDTDLVDEVEDSVAYLKALLKTKGNFQDEVYATLTFDKSIQVIRNFSKRYKREYQHFYNLSDGAYLEGLEPKRIEDVEVDGFEKMDKELYQTTLLKSLYKRSSNTLSKDEIDSMSRRYRYVDELISKIESNRQIRSFNTKSYQDQLLGLILDILDEYESEAWDLHNIYLSYFSFILPFVFDMLNTKELQNPKKHIKYIHPLLIRYTLEIAKYYKKDVERFFESDKEKTKSSEELLV